MSNKAGEEVFESEGGYDGGIEYKGGGGGGGGGGSGSLGAFVESFVGPGEKDVEKSSLNPSAAFEVFSGKVFYLASAKTNEYSLADSIEQRAETPMQRFARLRAELDDMQRELDELVGNEEEKNQEAAVWSILQGEARKMVQKATSLQSHPGFDAYQRRTASLSQRVEAATSSIAKGLPPTPSDASYSSSASSSSSHSDSVWELERRVASLETILGSASNALDIEGNSTLGLVNTNRTFPLVEALSRLERRVSLLDPAALDALKAKATTLKLELEAVQKTKSSAGEQRALDAAARVEDLFAQVERIRGVAEDVPALVIRLKTLESIHSNAASFMGRLQGMESAVGALADELKSNGELLGSLQEGLTENSLIFQSNVAKVEALLKR